MDENVNLNNSLERSHFNLLQKNRVTVNDIEPSNVIEIIRGLKKHNDQPLSGNYRVSILQSINKWKNWSIPPSKLKVKRNRSHLAFTSEYLGDLLRLLEYCLFTDFSSLLSDDPTIAGNCVFTARSEIDVIICILVIVSTPLDMRQMMSADIFHLDTLLNNDGNTPRVCNYNAFLKAREQILSLVQLRSMYFPPNDIRQYDSNRLCSVNRVVVNRQLRTLYVVVTGKNPPPHFGLYKLYKLPQKDYLLKRLESSPTVGNNKQTK